MRTFFKIVFGSCLGTILAMVLLLVIVASIGFMGAEKESISSNSVLKLEFKNPIPEKTNNVALEPYSFENPNALGLRRILYLIDQAANDDKIEGILLNTKDIQMGHTVARDLTLALENFKKSGKWIYSYADFYTQKAYLLNLAADSIFINPNGMVDLKGYGYLSPFFKDAFDNLGIKMEVFYAGNYKSATEPFRRNDLSPENKVQLREFFGEMADTLIGEVSRYRNISKVEVNNILKYYYGKNAISAMEHQLVDGVNYFDEIESKIKQKLGLEADKKIKYVSLEKYDRSQGLEDAGSSKNKVAIVYAEGTVNYNTADAGEINDKTYLELFDKLKRKKDLKAIVLRVNSPGGSSITSDIIWHELEELKAKGIPVVASFGDYAASGGYYISCGADTIVSEPTTLTGSIGVYSMFPNFSKLAREKLHVNFDTLQTHPYALGPTSVYDVSQNEENLFKESVDLIYQTFLSRVAQGRHISVDSVNTIGQGRVWTGNRAKQLGLVDEIGNLDDAIRIAAEMAKLEDYKIEEFPKIKRNKFLELLSQFESAEEIKQQFTPDSKTLLDLKKYQEFQKIFEEKGVQMRLPYLLEL
ncbi:MAG TPA: signal peptide peptidase SppA [Saprospiraceae bacterium]|nr:signal peptide peptidase SppA [Saprospiraceae bacterium]